MKTRSCLHVSTIVFLWILNIRSRLANPSDFTLFQFSSVPEILQQGMVDLVWFQLLSTVQLTTFTMELEARQRNQQIRLK